VVLIRLAAAVGLAWSAVACGSAPSPASPARPDARVVARWIAADGSVVVLNVSLGRGFDHRRIPAMARTYRAAHPASRLIVTFFDDAAGQERFVIGHVPTDGSALPAGRPASAIATFDFPRPTPTATNGAP
jgi:hypothetical protein